MVVKDIVYSRSLPNLVEISLTLPEILTCLFHEMPANAIFVFQNGVSRRPVGNAENVT